MLMGPAILNHEFGLWKASLFGPPVLVRQAMKLFFNSMALVFVYNKLSIKILGGFVVDERERERERESMTI
jgi:hypothetical protein